MRRRGLQAGASAALEALGSEWPRSGFQLCSSGGPSVLGTLLAAPSPPLVMGFTGPLQMADRTWRFPLQTGSKMEGLPQSGKKAPRAELSPASIDHPASLWLKRQFTALGVIIMTVTFS